MNMADGGIRVTKPTTGQPYYIEDIKVSVPHKVSVYIPADKFLNSKDLHRALSTGALFQLSGFIQQDSPEEIEPETPAPPPQVRAATPPSKSETSDLKESISRLETQIGLLTKALLERPTVTVAAPVTVATSGYVQVSPKEAASIDLDAPMFIPEDLVPKADVNIQVKEAVSSGDIRNASAKLKELRKAKS